MVSVTALRRDEFTLRDGEMALQHESENESDEDISVSGGTDHERNTCKSAINNFLSIVAIITVYIVL